ncbi:MAG TPA: response regulator [Steroidobacteraceae bacterium]|nr:response regulator [Steroidobacteraceae bacterium]
MNTLQTNQSSASTVVGEAQSPAPRASILLVDDQPARLLSYEAVLYGLGIQCVRALSGAQALERLLEQEFAAILLDVNMPEMDGFEVARLVREHPRLELTPIIFVTAVNISELDRLKGYELGAIDYIAVPVVPEILRSKVAVLVELHQRRGQLKAVNAELSAARAKLDAEHQKALAERDAQLQTLFEHPTDLTGILKAVRDESGALVDWIYTNVNRNAAAIMGRSRDEIVGRRVSELAPERAPTVFAQLRRVVELREPVRYESQFAGRDLVITLFAASDDYVVSNAQDVTEQRKLQRALEETDRRKDEFLAMLAHELRNPVAPIANAAELLARLVPQENQRTLVGIIQRQAVHLGRLLDDLLDVARITRGRIELRREVIDVATCVHMAIETAEPLIRSKAHQLTLTQTLEPICVSADKVRLGQCIANVLVNAAKYTPDGGEIRIRPHVEGNTAVVEIADNGIGIAPEFLPRIFELFAQSERGLDRSQGGLGVGLTVCKQIVELHGGSVVASSPGVGHGSTFTIRLPLTEQAATEPRAAELQSDSLLRVLIVDDNRDAADSLAMLLQFEGRQTLCVYSGEQALEMLAAFQPQLVLLDIGLPGIDGYEVARRLKAAAPGLQVIALSGYAQLEDRQRSAAAGFDAHLVKPIDLDALKRALAPASRG